MSCKGNLQDLANDLCRAWIEGLPSEELPLDPESPKAKLVHRCLDAGLIPRVEEGERVAREPMEGEPFPDAWRCRTCRWWEALPPEDATSGTCTLASRVGRRKMLATKPGSGVLTVPDFGCVQWEPRE